MNIVILDGFTANPGDLSWDFLKKYGELTVYDRTPPQKVISRAENADIVIINKTPLTAELISALPRLRLVALLATGYNVVDCAECSKRGILVANIPSYSVSAVAQQVFAFILEYANRIGEHSASVLSGEWAGYPDFCYQKAPLSELCGKTLGIIGFGRIGQRVAQIGSAFEMTVLANTAHPERHSGGGVSFTGLPELLSRSDFVTLHCPLTPQTQGMVNAEFIAQMKDGAFLVNTSRGAELDEAAVAAALNSGKLGGAGVDVLSTEPPCRDNPLLHAKNIFITPHIAWAPFETRRRLMGVLEENISAFISGKPINIVNMQ